MIRILDFAEVTADEVFARSEPTADVSDIVSAIIKDVRENGDEALMDLSWSSAMKKKRVPCADSTRQIRDFRM